MHERGQLAVHAPLHDTVVRLVGEEDISFAVAGRAFGESELAGQLLEGRAGSDDLDLCRQRLCRAEQAQEEPDQVIHVSLDARSEIKMLSGVKQESQRWPGRRQSYGQNKADLQSSASENCVL